MHSVESYAQANGPRLVLKVMAIVAVIVLAVIFGCQLAKGQARPEAVPDQIGYAEVPPAGYQWVVVLKCETSDVVKVGFVVPYTIRLGGIKAPEDQAQAEQAKKVLAAMLASNTLLRARVRRDREGKPMLDLYDDAGYSIAHRLEQGGYARRVDE